MNVADDILYSGTVAGAMEAAHCLACLPSPCRNVTAATTRLPIMPPASVYGVSGDTAYCWESEHSRTHTVMNVNFPKTDPASIKGVKPAHLDRHKLGDVVINGGAPNHFRLGPLHSDPETSDGSDRAVLNDGWISLTPLMMDVTAHHLLEQLPILDIAASK